MSIMGKDVWAIVCGAIRQEFELYDTLAILCEYRHRNLIKGIVISTWEGEIDQLQNLRSKLKALNIEIVESEPIDEDICKFVDINYARQAKQLKSGLDIIPDDVFVVKCRTDLSETHLKLIEDFLLGDIDLSIGQFGAFDAGMQYKMVVHRYPATIPFVLNDICFLGYKSDIKKMVNLDATALKNNITIMPDAWFFMGIFSQRFPILEEFLDLLSNFQFFNSGIFQNRLRVYLNSCEENKDNFVLPGILNKFFALYFIILYTCFYPSMSYKETVDSFDFSSIFTCDNKIRMVNEWSFCFGNTDSLRKVVEGECFLTKGYIKFYNEVCKFASFNYSQKARFTQQDYQETCEWIKQVCNEGPGKWFTWKKKDFNFNIDYSFDQAVDILWSDYNMNSCDKDKWSTLLYDVSFTKQRHFYQLLLDYKKEFEQFDRNLFETVIGPIGKSENPHALLFCAKELYNKKIDAVHEKSARFIFERWANHPARLYAFPMPAEKLSALYYYSKYSESFDNTIACNLYNSLLRNFNLPASEVKSAFSDLIVNAIKEIVSIHYKSYETNLSVKYMIEFLADEFYYSAFTQEQYLYLERYIVNRHYALPFKKADPKAFTNLVSGIEKVNSEFEADYILKLLLREKWNQPIEIQQTADIFIKDLIQNYSLQNSCFENANTMNKNDILLFNPSELAEDEDFVLLLRILSERKCLSTVKEVLFQLYGNNLFRKVIIEFFLQLECNDKIKFFSMKNNTELWFNYTPFKCHVINSEFVMIRDNNDFQWPMADCASSSPFAAFIKLSPNVIYVSIEFSSWQCIAKAKLLEAIDKTKIMPFNIASSIIRLKTAVYPISPNDEISSAVSKALADFCEIGELLVEAADKVCKGGAI